MTPLAGQRRSWKRRISARSPRQSLSRLPVTKCYDLSQSLASPIIVSLAHSTDRVRAGLQKIYPNGGHNSFNRPTDQALLRVSKVEERWFYVQPPVAVSRFKTVIQTCNCRVFSP